MIMQQKVDTHLLSRLFVKNWRFFKDFNYFLVLVINFMHMLTY